MLIKYSLLFFLSITHLVTNAQWMSDSFLIDHHYRTFHFNNPADLKVNASLIFILHGSGTSGEYMLKSTIKLNKVSHSENILLVYPDGYKNYWNECRKASTAAANIEDIDENTFFDKMIEYFELKYKTSSDNIFAIGFSGGGHMAYKLAITMPQKFKAITAIVANLPDTANMDCVEKKVPISVMIVNGTADKVNPYGGGEVIIPNVKLGKVRSTEQTFKYWYELAGYKGTPKKEILPDTDPNDGKTVEKYSFKEKGKPEIVLLKVINGIHDDPKDLDVYLEAWSFFKRQIKLE